ncbi:MAG: hypothetical protein WCI04_00805 [archaeon]
MSSLRTVKLKSAHHIEAAVLGVMDSHKLRVVPLALRRAYARSLIELKRNKFNYDFGSMQLKALDYLINQSRKARGYGDIADVHKCTCLLGFDKQ